mmetsp:Transcript_79533/g.177867  ORF Transcript_79533/g.177867 Transcript_79533/m.177867 type:complete len:176 (-) Transcript_79533:50-577(-)
MAFAGKPFAGSSSRARHSSALMPRSRLDLAFDRDRDPVKDWTSSANTFYPGGTHRTPQCKENERTPGPGAYKTTATFPLRHPGETSARGCGYRREPSWSMTLRSKGRVAHMANEYNVVPPVVSIFRRVAGSNIEDLDQKMESSKVLVHTLPPCTVSGEILKGHGGDVPRGHGLPF